MAYYHCWRKYAFGGCIKCGESVADSQTGRFGHAEVECVDVLTPAAGVVEESSLFEEVAEDFFGEEDVPFRLFVQHSHQTGRERLPGECLEKLGEILARERTDLQPFD